MKNVYLIGFMGAGKSTIAKGLCEYEYIMENWKNDDTDFREVYYEFYLKARWAVMSNPNNNIPYFTDNEKKNTEVFTLPTY